MDHLLGLFLSPLISSALLSILPKNQKNLAALFSLIPLFLLLYFHNDWLGREINYNWLTPLSIRFHLAIDSLSLLFLYLTAIVTPISLLAARTESSFFYSLILLLQAFLIGFFTAQDLVLFTIFWEAMLLPLYFIITGWGGAQRKKAATQFILYLIAGSAMLIVAILALFFSENTFDLKQLAQTSNEHALWIFAIFALAFAVKTPLFPFHGWLPDAYFEAPLSGTLLLSGLLSKAGIYGFLRIGRELFPSAMQTLTPLLLTLAITGTFYAGFAAWKQTDFKRLIAYSSLSHVNFILAGIFTVNSIGETGAIIQSFNHGITITALFLAAGWLADRIGTTSMETSKGLAKYLPHLCWLTLFFVLSSVALPGLNNFVGEIIILRGLFIHHPWQSATLAATVILSVMYMLRWMQKIYFDTPTTLQAKDIGSKEWALALPLIALILWIGIYPAPLLQLFNPEFKKTEESR